MKLLIYGSEGWIGKQFIEILDKNNIQYIKGNSRTNNKKTLEKNFPRNKRSCPKDFPLRLKVLHRQKIKENEDKKT